MDRFKSVLVEEEGNPRRRWRRHIDLNGRAGLVEDPKDYTAGAARWRRRGIEGTAWAEVVWATHAVARATGCRW